MRRISKQKYIKLESTSTCQLRCPSCPTANRTTLPALGKGFLRANDFRKLLDENPTIKEIELSNYGEMFLNPHLLEIMKYANEKKLSLTAANGVNLNNVREEVLEGLVKYKFRRMNCSIDGASEVSYAKYRVGGNYNTVIRNIETINTFKKKYRSKYPILSWQFIIFGHNEGELLKARRMSKSLNMHFHPKLSWDNKLSPCSREVAVKEFGVASREEYQNKHGANYMQSICHQLWDSPQINWDGKVLGCCRNFWGDFGGNVFDDGLINALNNEKINYAKGMLQGVNEERNDIPCTTCDIYLAMKNNKSWLARGLKRKFILMSGRLYKLVFRQ